MSSLDNMMAKAYGTKTNTKRQQLVLSVREETHSILKGLAKKHGATQGEILDKIIEILGSNDRSNRGVLDQ